jgi:predicted GNAT family acetyltransferase
VKAPAPLSIRHDVDGRRFSAEVDGETAYIAYREAEGGVLDLNHTFVPRTSRGGGIASQLTARALEHAREHGLRIVPSCPFVAAYIARHPEYRDLVA